MKFQYEDEVVVSLNNLENIAGIKCIKKNDDIFIYKIMDWRVADNLKKQKNMVHYMDRFYIILPDSYQEQERLWRYFYLNFGEQYESIINITHNCSCISFMLDYLTNRQKLTIGSTVLDFGCGSGLSKLCKNAVNVLGYESIDIMRTQAIQRGLKVLSGNELQSYDKFFDGVFASYVLHMAISEKDITIVRDKMRDGAVWIANFYKDINVETVNYIFSKNGFDVKEVVCVQEGFGSVYEYRKKL